MASRELLAGFDHRVTEPAGGGPAERAGVDVAQAAVGHEKHEGTRTVSTGKLSASGSVENLPPQLESGVSQLCACV